MAAGQTASSIGGYQAARTAHKWQQRQHELNTEAALDSATRQYGDLATQRLQIEQSAAQEGFELAREARLGAGAVATAAAASGVEGASVREAKLSFASHYAESAAIRKKNLTASKRQIMRDLDAIRAQTKARIASTQPGPAPGFNWLGLLGGLAGGSANIVASLPNSNG